MMFANTRFRALLVAIVVALPLAVACGGDEDEAPAPTQPPGEATEPAPPATPDPGVTDTEILLGQHSILSGPAAIYAIIPEASQAYFEYINETEGGVNGRKIRLEFRDNQYPNPAEAKVVTQQLVEQVGVFAMFSNFGTATHAAVIDYLAEKGVPDMFIAAPFTGFTEPVRPYSFGGVPTYTTEAQMIGTYLNENMPDAKVGILYQNDDFGRDYIDGMNRFFEGEIALTAAYDPAETDTSSQTAQLVNAGVDVIILACTPRPCASAIRSAREAGSDVQFIMSGVSNIDVMFALAGDPANLEGTLVPAYAKTIAETEDPAIQKHIEIMQAAGIEPSNFSVFGHVLAELMVEVLKNAGDPPTRQGVLEAAENMRGWQSNLALTSVCMSPEDHRPWEALRFWRAEAGRWVVFGEVMSFESTPDC